MRRVETLIIGGGQAGLALSRHLTGRGREHLVLERGRIAERWRSERWDSFRLLTPNWATRLPGLVRSDVDPDGFMRGSELVRQLEAYAASFSAPVEERVEVRAVRPDSRGWRAITDGGTIEARNVVLATGHHGLPRLPAVASELPRGLHQLHSREYRNPGQLPDGAVLVVGAGPSGQQIAKELASSGRRVVLAVGRHTGAPRAYRGLDAFRWMELLGMLTESIAGQPDPQSAWRRPSLVLAGDGADLDVRTLAANGVEVTGGLLAVRDGLARFDDPVQRIAEADAAHLRLRVAADDLVVRTGMTVGASEPPPPSFTPRAPDRLDLTRTGVAAVVWATGFRRDYSWVHAPITDGRGEPVHHRGIGALPGLMFLGLRWQTMRSSNFLYGVGQDAEFLAEWVDRRGRRRGAA